MSAMRRNAALRLSAKPGLHGIRKASQNNFRVSCRFLDQAAFQKSRKFSVGELILCSRCVRQLVVERLAISEASSEELRPVGNTRSEIDRFRKQSPQFWMVPTELMACAIPVPPDSCPQPFDFYDERISVQGRKVFIHT
jgi:hypothetical protein